MLWRQFRGATEPCTVLIGWSDREFSFKYKRRTERWLAFFELGAAGEPATRRHPRSVARAWDGRDIRARNAQWIRKSRRSGLRNAQSACPGWTDMGRCPVGTRLELSLFQLASAHVGFAYGGRATLRKKSSRASLHQCAPTYFRRGLAFSVDRKRYRTRAAKRRSGGTVCGAAFERRSSRLDLRTQICALRFFLFAGDRSVRLVCEKAGRGTLPLGSFVFWSGNNS